MPASEIRVILVEDDEDLRSALSTFLKLTGFSVAEESSALGFYDRLSRESFDVAIIDLVLPDLDGFHLIQFMRNRTESAVIVLTANDDIDNRVCSYNSGADLFMGKPIDTRELVAAIHSLAVRRLNLSNPVLVPDTGEVPWRLVRASRQLVTPDGTTIRVTGTEFIALEFLAGARQVVKHELLAEKLYGRVDESSKKALDAVIGRLRRKIAESSTIVPIQTSYGIGYIFAATILIG